MSDLINLVNKFDTVLFDMDGTIVNTEPLHAKAAAKVLNELGIEIDLEACLSKYYGMTDTDVLKMECPQFTEQQVEETIHKKNEKLIELFKTLSHEEKKSFITPGFFEFITHLKNQGKKLAVVSASEDIIVYETLKCFEIDQYIQLQMGRNQTVLTKPNPDPYLEAMKRLNTSPQKTIIFEDSPTGLKAAKATNAQVVRITGFAHDDIKSEFVEFKNFMS